jgi:glycyl-tRNA synthetase (class II)
VTIRDRDTMMQDRVSIESLRNIIDAKTSIRSLLQQVK